MNRTESLGAYSYNPSCPQNGSSEDGCVDSRKSSRINWRQILETSTLVEGEIFQSNTETLYFVHISIKLPFFALQLKVRC